MEQSLDFLSQALAGITYRNVLSAPTPTLSLGDPPTTQTKPGRSLQDVESEVQRRFTTDRRVQQLALGVMVDSVLRTVRAVAQRLHVHGRPATPPSWVVFVVLAEKYKVWISTSLLHRQSFDPATSPYIFCLHAPSDLHSHSIPSPTTLTIPSDLHSHSFPSSHSPWPGAWKINNGVDARQRHLPAFLQQHHLSA